MLRGGLIRRVGRREHVCESLECIISGFELVDGGWFDDRCRQGVPLANHSVCVEIGSLRALCWVLAGESSFVPPDSIGWAGMAEWARLDHRVRPTDVYYLSIILRTSYKNIHFHAKKLVLKMYLIMFYFTQ